MRGHVFQHMDSNKFNGTIKKSIIKTEIIVGRSSSLSLQILYLIIGYMQNR